MYSYYQLRGIYPASSFSLLHKICEMIDAKKQVQYVSTKQHSPKP